MVNNYVNNDNTCTPARRVITNRRLDEKQYFVAIYSLCVTNYFYSTLVNSDLTALASYVHVASAVSIKFQNVAS